MVDDTPQGIINTITSGTWGITNFWDDGDRTSQFAGYIFTFDINGTLTAIYGAISYTGTWTVFTEGDNLNLEISFVLPVEFQDISYDWNIYEHRDNLIKMQDISGGIGSTRYLDFTKN
jgi:hypothetical protein